MKPRFSSLHVLPSVHHTREKAASVREKVLKSKHRHKAASTGPDLRRLDLRFCEQEVSFVVCQEMRLGPSSQDLSLE